jgi:hypothetical protein
MARIELNSLIGNMTPVQQIFCSWFYSQFDNNNAAHRIIINVEPISYFGAIAGSEFTAYVNNKLYICLEAVYLYNSISANVGVITAYNEANAAFQYFQNNALTFNTVTLVHNSLVNDCLTYNYYFSRISTVNYINMNFKGYRVTLN